MRLTMQQRAYCELAQEYQATLDPQNALALDDAMRAMERDDPDVATLVDKYTDEELIEMLESEER